MRSIKELLELMLKNEQGFFSGLCSWVNYLYSSKIINLEEKLLLIRYIENNRPSKWSSFSAFKYRNTHFYWEWKNIKPRIKWIKKHIKLNS
jgi:hypothetical protein